MGQLSLGMAYNGVSEVFPIADLGSTSQGSLTWAELARASGDTPWDYERHYRAVVAACRDASALRPDDGTGLCDNSSRRLAAEWDDGYMHATPRAVVVVSTLRRGRINSAIKLNVFCAQRFSVYLYDFCD